MIRVGVLRGGTGNKYDESLATGAYVLKNLSRENYEPLDLFVDREGTWHLGGTPVTEDKLKMRVDVIWNALHGFYGADGKAQQTIENLGIPYTGSGPLASAITMNKKLSKDYLAKRGIKTPRGVYVEDWGEGDREEIVKEVVHNIAKKLSPPWIIEPISRPKGDGAMRAKTRDELTAVLLHMFDADIPVLIEEGVLGKEISTSVISKFRGEDTYTFLPVIKNDFRARLKKSESEEIQKISADVHKAFGLDHYSRIEAVITSQGSIFIISADTVPELHENSDLHHSLESLGVTFDEFARQMIEGARGR